MREGFPHNPDNSHEALEKPKALTEQSELNTELPPLMLPDKSEVFGDIEAEPSIYKTIETFEKELGLRSSSDRLLETSLFIDKKFLQVAIVTENSFRQERMFGNEAWADWLEGRIEARRYGRRPIPLKL